MQNSSKKRLIHCITNPIAMNLTANGVLALGASPIMAEHPKEVAEITQRAAALLLNFGNISDTRMEAMKIALATANERKIPVVLDVCGISCSTLRKKFFQELLLEKRVDVIKGNYSEILSLYEKDYVTSGVDAESTAEETTVLFAAKKLAKKYHAMVLATGAVDLLATPEPESDRNQSRDVGVMVQKKADDVWRQTKGSAQLGKITATGCLLGAVIATFLSVKNTATSVKNAVSFFAECGEKAETKFGNGTFQLRLLDYLSHYEDERNMELNTELYFITDSSSYEEDEFFKRVESALEGGVTLLQLREKNKSTKDYIDLATKVHNLTKKYGVPLIIDDRVDVMLAVDAEGVHLGKEDMPLELARKMIGPKKILGATAKTVEAAKSAEKNGADYLGVGAIYPTTTKVKTVLTPVETLRDICHEVSIPVNAIGGLNPTNMDVLKGISVSGVCAVSAIMKADSPKEAAEAMKKKYEEISQ
ncbi:MAG: thiamine phosphate synthase [Lachnospiraceae bacterium]|nr:thiamine phosphate synthase [Lachnospiraceae bacterium]